MENISLMTLFIGVCCIISYALAQNIAFDCTSDQSNYTTISLLEVGNCHFEDDDFEEESTEIQLLKLREATNVQVFSCMIALNYDILTCGMHSHNSLVKGGKVSEIYQLSYEECLTMHKLRRARVYGQEFQIRKFNETYSSWVTLAGGIDHDGTCSGGDFNNGRGNYRNVVVHGEIKFLFSTGNAIRMIKEDKLQLNSGITCKIDENNCLDPVYGRTFWKVETMFPCSVDAYHVLYSGPGTKVKTVVGKTLSGAPITSIMFSVKNEKQIFTLTTVGEKNVCRFNMYQTEHPSYMITEIAKNKYYFNSAPIPVGELDPFIYINSKVIYVAHGIENAMRRMHRSLSVKICEMERNHLMTLQTLAQIAPVSFAYQYMGSPGYTAISAGEVIHVVKCHPVPVTPRHEEDCTIEYPVFFKNESFFVTPRSHLLQKSGTPAPCASMLTPEYKFGNRWFSLNKGLSPTGTPLVLSPKNPLPWEGLDLGNLMVAGIYTNEQIDQIRHQIMYPQERKSINERVASSINGDSVSSSPIDYSIFISEEKLRSKFHEFWMETWGWFKFIGNFGSAFFTIYVCIVFVIKASSALARVKMLHELFGCSHMIFASLCEGLSDYILHRNSHKFGVPKENKVELQAIDHNKVTNDSMKRLPIEREHIRYSDLGFHQFIDMPNAPKE